MIPADAGGWDGRERVVASMGWWRLAEYAGN
jgi:hypothetical protein